MRQVDTPEFKRWFQGSVVVDEQGEPLVMYHGNVGGLEDGVFRPSVRGESGRGIYLTDSPETAARWADVKALWKKNNGQAVVPVYVALKHPLDTSFNTVDRPTLEHRIEEIAPQAFVRDLNGRLRLPSGKDTTDVLIELGFDGIIRRTWDGRIHEIVVFEPTQIKSAIGNKGSFDPHSPRIFKGIDMNLTDTPEFKRWFRESKVVVPKTSTRDTSAPVPLVVYHGTKSGEFDVFEVGRATHNTITFGADGTWETKRAGVFFSESLAFAQSFAGESGVVIPAYLSIQDPLWLEDGFEDEDIERLVRAGVDENWMRRVSHNPLALWGLFDADNGGFEFVERVKAAGYDGAFILEGFEEQEDPVRVWIAFEPTQIKSAFRNKGTFDPSNPSIFEGFDMNLTLGKVYSKAEMLKAGADGFLDHALLTKIPVNLITGREPTPSMEGGYKEGTPIMQPVEVMFDRGSNSYVLYAGNHRVTQAEINGEDSILAFVEDPLRRYEELKSASGGFGDMSSLDAQKLASRLDVSEDFAKVVIAAINRLGLRNYRIQPTALGCGSEGCVFPAVDAQGREVVVKVSESDSDLNAAAWLKKNPHSMFPVVYAVFQLDGFKAYASRGIRFNVVVREDIPSGRVDSHVLYAMTLAGSAMRAAERQFPDAAKYLKDVQAEAAKASDVANARRVVEWCQWCMERGVVFEDVSEDNVGVRENGEVVLRDFGFNRTPKASRVLFADYPTQEERLHLSGFGADDPMQRLVEASIAEFGTTRDIREAGFILPDGRLLDLSGKNDGGNPGERSRDHYEISAPARKAGIQGERYDVLTGVLKRGFIRISYIPSNRYFAAHFGAHPTSAQARALAAFVKACDSANVDVEVGEKTHTYELEGRVTVRKVLDAVEQHYAAPADFGSNVGPEDSEDWSDGEPEDFEGFGDDAPDPYSLKRPHIGGKRQRRVSACASDNLDLKWMRLDSCISRAGGTLKQATIHSPDGVSNFMHEVFPIANMGYEEFYVIPVDTKHVPLGVAKIAQGGVSSTVVDRVLVLRPAVMLGAKAMFIVHNHPSGNASPSNDDIVLTKAIKQAAETIGVPLLDHVIVTPDRRIYYSFVEGGIR